LGVRGDVFIVASDRYELLLCCAASFCCVVCFVAVFARWI